MEIRRYEGDEINTRHQIQTRVYENNLEIVPRIVTKKQEIQNDRNNPELLKVFIDNPFTK